MTRFYSVDECVEMDRADILQKEVAQSFWSGVAWSSVMWLCLIVLVLAVNVTYIKDVIIYAGQVSALQGDVKELPMMGVGK